MLFKTPESCIPIGQTIWYALNKLLLSNIAYYVYDMWKSL